MELRQQSELIDEMKVVAFRSMIPNGWEEHVIQHEKIFPKYLDQRKEVMHLCQAHLAQNKPTAKGSGTGAAPMGVDWLGKKGKKASGKSKGLGRGKRKPVAATYDEAGKSKSKKGFLSFFKKGKGKGKGRANKGKGINDLGEEEHSQT